MTDERTDQSTPIEELIGWFPTGRSPERWLTPEGEGRGHATVYDLVEYLKRVDRVAPYAALEAVIRLHARVQSGEFIDA